MGVPSVTASSSAVVDHTYTVSLSETGTLVFSGRGNLYGFLVENNSASDVFIQFYDAGSIGAVTPGTDIKFTFKIPASGAMGKDVNDSPIHFFAKGCVALVTSSRTTGAAPASPATAQFWAYNSKY